MCILRGAAMFDFSIFSSNLKNLDNFELVDLKLWIWGLRHCWIGSIGPMGGGLHLRHPLIRASVVFGTKLHIEHCNVAHSTVAAVCSV